MSDAVPEPEEVKPYGFGFAGGRFEIADPAAVLSGAGPSAAPILVSEDPDVTVLISRPGRDAGRRYHLEGRVRRTAPGFEGSMHPAIVGLAYVAPVMDALNRLMGEVGRSPGTGSPSPDAVQVQDPITGLTATTTPGRAGWDGKVSQLVEAQIPVEGAGPAQLAAFVRIVFDVAREQSGAGGDARFLTGRRFAVALVAAAPPSSSGASAAKPSGSGTERLDLDDDVRLDQLGGLDDVVAQLRDVADSFAHPQVMARWGASRPQGILMWGPPGTGKTTLARALAAEIGGTLKEIRTPDILDQWVGSSERNIKKIFAEARKYRTPTVLLFDEFDSIISYNGAPRGGADQVGNSVAGIFKQEMNTLIDDNPNVIVVATTNFPQRVDESLIRSGRFDIKLSVPLPDASGRADIWTKLLARLIERHEVDGFRLFADDLDIPALGLAGPGLSGADLKEALRRVQLTKAMQEARGGTPEAISQAELLSEIDRLVRKKPTR